jgi:hypothetical protein
MGHAHNQPDIPGGHFPGRHLSQRQQIRPDITSSLGSLIAHTGDRICGAASASGACFSARLQNDAISLERTIPMRHTFPKTIVVSALIGMGALGVARADCESDLIQLEQPTRHPSLRRRPRRPWTTPRQKRCLRLKRTMAPAAIRQSHKHCPRRGSR